MIKDKITRQEGGEKSTNLQGQSIVINQGISYKDAKEIATDVFKSNYLELSSKAAATARERAEELIDDFLKEVKGRNPEAIKTMEDPGMQHAIFLAQKDYARIGDKNLSDMLVDILVDRASQTERNLIQIVLDESLNIVPKLTNSQLDTLTVAFILKYSRNHNVNNLNTFKKYLISHLKPFTSSLSKENSLYQHLEFTGCVSVSIGSSNIENILSQTYKGIFCKGFTEEEFDMQEGNFEKFKPLLVPCLQDKTKYQLNAIDDDTLDQKAKQLKLTDFDIITLKPFLNSHQMNGKELKDIIIDQGKFMNTLFDVWDNSSLKSITLTSVGIAIAQANLRRKTGITVDLGIWIK
ncbi:LPO_1073/Vpar_1526 family protein [Fulvivirga sp.]|uniref:LPO_1073/Vpar_1526 family protein n=1 Tax=Fulvivirga sp. TaxID=1931237 RepID=UPI0032EEE18A